MKNFDLFINDLKRLIACRPVYEKDGSGYPFGKCIKNALDTFLDIADKMGFETHNYDDYMGEVVFGEGEEVGIIGHLDVVPVGSGWSTEPFNLTIKDDALFGRGVADDIGPLLLCLYALKQLKDEGVLPNRKFRIFAGCDEETGWRDVDYFNTVGRFSEYGFSPDGNFPVVYAEKGMAIITFKIPHLKNFCFLKGGTVVNAVCGEATVCAKTDACERALTPVLRAKHGLMTLDNGIIKSVGKSCHGSMPEQGVNALKALFEYFAEVGEDVGSVNDYLFNDKSGLSKIGNEQGYVTLSPDIVREEADGIYIDCDCRFPAPLSLGDLLPVFDTFGIEYVAAEKHPSFMVEKEGDFVQTLLGAYNEVMGVKALPQAQNGSTFARVFEKGCAFGAEFPNVPSTIHQLNENISIADVKKMYNIYYLAVKNFAEKA